MIKINNKLIVYIVIIFLLILFHNFQIFAIDIESDILKKLNESSEISVVVELKSNTLTNSILSDLTKTEFKLEEIVLGDTAFFGNITQEGLNKLKNNPEVRLIYLNRKLHILLQESLPLINANNTWALGYTGKDQTICVIDGGINWSHPALGGCIGTGCKVLGGYDYYNNDNNPMDDNGNGTHVAGIAAAKGTINGTAPDAKLIAMKVCDSTGTDCPTIRISQAIDWCISNLSIFNISVISISLGDSAEYTNDNCPSGAQTQINNATFHNISVIIASGNNGFINGISHPACRGNVTSVGMTYDDSGGVGWLDANCSDISSEGTYVVDGIACATNRGSNLDLLAPGRLIVSTSIDGSIIGDGGTSMAAPHVSGAAAILLQKNPNLTPKEIREALNKTGKKINDTFNSRNNGGSSNITFSRINILAATESINQSQTTFPSILYNCTETGYDQCIGFSSGDCNVTLAINNYENVNDIQWGVVNDSADPYVIRNYSFGWKLIKGRDMYYKVINPGENGEDDCNFEDGCGGDDVANTRNLSTINAPGIAYHENIVGYNKTAINACWAWFNEFTPNYGQNNLIYVLHCFDENDCSYGDYCDKTGSWPDWHCVQKKGDGQNCSNNFECSSRYCDNDGVGLSDDTICFTPYNTYFDGNEIKSCEYSVGGNISCDEKEIGNGCSVYCNYSVVAPSIPYIKHPNGNEKFNLSSIITINWTLSNDSERDFIRYFIEYSNDSGNNWTTITSNYGYENKLNDSATKKVLNFTQNENKTIYIKIPNRANVTYARIDFGGLSYNG